jgi:hypothetical protein
MSQNQQEVTKYLTYHFTVEEKAALSESLVHNTQELETLTDRKKQVMSDFTAKINASNADIFKTARLLSNGYEYRDVKCTVVLDEPRKGMKRIVRQDTGEVVSEDAMTSTEMQYMLDLDLEATQAEVKAEAQPPTPEAAPEERPIEPEPEEESGDETPAVIEMPAPRSEPVRIAGEGDGWTAEIVILDTSAGFVGEGSFTLRNFEPVPVNTPGVFLSESECRQVAARAIWEAARERDSSDSEWTGRKVRQALRAVMAWAQQQMENGTPA